MQQDIACRSSCQHSGETAVQQCSRISPGQLKQSPHSSPPIQMRFPKENRPDRPPRLDWIERHEILLCFLFFFLCMSISLSDLAIHSPTQCDPLPNPMRPTHPPPPPQDAKKKKEHFFWQHKAAERHTKLRLNAMAWSRSFQTGLAADLSILSFQPGLAADLRRKQPELSTRSGGRPQKKAA